ncbi:MAG: AMP-binding protein [Alphaproteobacteria bacterium]|nr:AMP-binding protein [Alphaproteobacteria bacterium]
MSAAPIWSHAEVWDSVAAALPDARAIVQGERVLTWADFSRRSDALAAHLLERGLSRQSKVAVYTQNRPDYLIAYYAAFKAGLAPFNVNYRYAADEVLYLLENGDAEAVVFETLYAPLIERIRTRAPLVKTWLAIADEGEAIPPWAEAFADVAARTPVAQPVSAPWGRSGDDLLILYTGGTTGMPKGVMWRQHDLFGRYGFVSNALVGIEPLGHPHEAGPRAAAGIVPRPIALIAPPLMHGTGQLGATNAFSFGGTVVLLPKGRFDPEALWDAVHRERVTRISIVGQPFAQPMLDALDAHPERWDVSCVLGIISSGAMWSRENKKGLLRHMPQAALTDAFSSSEAIGMGTSIMTANAEFETARFTIGPDCAVFTEDGRRVTPGSGERGRTAVGGFLPLGYYKDQAKTDATFKIIEGRRWSVPGDWAEVTAAGELILLGRGSQCINTGGEKVFPEEVEEALKEHPSVRDAAVTGLPDPRMGERVAALVELSAPAEVADLIAHVRERLAHYKAPRHVLIVDTVARAPNGKLDYKAIKARALDAFAAADQPAT